MRQRNPRDKAGAVRLPDELLADLGAVPGAGVTDRRGSVSHAVGPGLEDEPLCRVAGASQPEPLLDQAELLGRRLAEAGAIVVCGGGRGDGSGLPRRRSAGGTTVGLLPGLDRAEGNPYLTISDPTGLGQGRNLLLVRSSDAVIAVGGGFGTLSEIAIALRTGTPVIGLATWSLHLGSHQVDAFPVADTPDAAAQLALDAARSRARLRRPPHGG
jgi:uncharacterized protein (TIGR00725 family)